MISKKGLALPVTIIIVLVISIIVLLILITFMGWGWETGPINQTQEGIDEQYEEQDPLGDIFNSTQNHHRTSKHTHRPGIHTVEEWLDAR